MTSATETPSPALPVLGAALTVAALPLHRDWLVARDRDVELQDFCFAEILDGDWRSLAEEARRRLDGWHGRLGIHGPFWGFTIDSEDPEVRAVVARRMQQGLDVCRALGADQMVIHSPYTTWDSTDLAARPAAAERLVERVHQTLDAVVARAADDGVTLVVENIEDVDPRIRLELARSFPGETVRPSIDTGHAHWAHRSAGAPPVDVFVTEAGGSLDHVHLQDTDGWADRHWHPGEGTIGWTAVFRALRRFTGRPRLLLEVDDLAGLRRGADHLVGLGLAE
jgi:sugar phosphate isomerase/epimerase